MYDTLVSGGVVVTPDGVRGVDIAIANGRIEALLERPHASSADEIVDATGLVVLPGGVDAHVHAAPTGLGAVAEPFTRDPPGTMGRAALLGGTTTLIDFAFSVNGSLREGIARKEAQWRAAPCDHAFHVLLRDDVDRGQLDELAGLVADGHPSVKVFMTNGAPSRAQRLRLDLGSLHDVLRIVAGGRGILAVHAEDDELVRHGYAVAEAAGRTALAAIPDVRSALAEELAIREVTTLARRVSGAAVYIMHVTSADGVAAIREARSAGVSVYGEALHNYLVFDASVYERSDGALFHTFPSLRPAADREALVAAALQGHLATIATDAGLGGRERKLAGRTLNDVRGGHVGVQTRLAVAYTELVHRRGLPVEELARRTATTPARLFGLGAKGSIAPGYDADLALVEVSKRRLRGEDLVEADYSVWQDYEAAAWPRRVLLRGRTVMTDGQISDATSGRAVAGRRVDEGVHAGLVA
jgi:dihydropyrimidinase